MGLDDGIILTGLTLFCGVVWILQVNTGDSVLSEVLGSEYTWVGGSRATEFVELVPIPWNAAVLKQVNKQDNVECVYPEIDQAT